MNKIYNSKSSAKRSTKSWLFLAISVLLAISLIGCIAQSAVPAANDAKNDTGKNTTKNTENHTTNSTTNVSSGNFSVGIIADNKTGIEKVQETIALAVADGVYSQNVTYARPGGNEEVNMTIAVEGDVVTAASITGTPSSPISAGFISKVNAALPELVVGKKITALDLPKQIAGSSLTTAAFKQYVADVVETH